MVGFFGNKRVDEGVAMKCMICKAEMMSKMIENVEIDLCLNCGGAWLDGGELEAVSGVDLQLHRRLSCPMCDFPMDIRTVRGTEIDWCPKCDGVWLDTGEFERITGISPETEQGDSFSNFKNAIMFTRNISNVLEWSSNMSPRSVDRTMIIEDIFLMHNNGCLVAHSTRRLKPQMDVDILGSMLVEIQDFVKDAFKDESKFSLKNISFGEKNVLLNRGHWVILAVVLSGKADKYIHNKIRASIEEIEESYRTKLPNWNGVIDDLRGCRDIISRIYD